LIASIELVGINCLIIYPPPLGRQTEMSSTIWGSNIGDKFVWKAVFEEIVGWIKSHVKYSIGVIMENNIERRKVQRPKKKKMKAIKKTSLLKLYILQNVIKMTPIISMIAKANKVAKKAVTI
jgi:hypothetical protein